MQVKLPHDYPERIRKLRGRLGLTQTQLANKLGVSFASVNRWENRQSSPNRLAWQRLEAAESQGLAALETPYPTTRQDHPEVNAGLSATEAPPLDFAGDPEGVRALVESQWLAEGYRTNPAFAIETSLVDPLPHQRLAVYERMLNQPRLRFLLADDAGAGKTIMTGLYVREMLSRRLIKRVLVVVPAGLVGNWHREMHSLFRLPFSIARGDDARAGNPFTGPDSDLLIVSIDTLASDRMFARLQDPLVQPYDLAVFDEVHKLSATRDSDGTFRPTDRYRVAEALAGVPDGPPARRLRWSASHVLLLTATPHMGKELPYFYLWRLLDPLVLSTPEAFAALPHDARSRHFIRRTKEEMVTLDGAPLYPMRVSDTLSFDLSPGEIGEKTLYDRTSEYMRSVYNRARILNRSAARLAISVFQRRLASSTWALLCSFDRRIEKLDRLIEDIRSGRLAEADLLARQRQLDERARDPFEEHTGDDEEGAEGEEQCEAQEAEALGCVVATSLAELQAEKLTVESLRDLARSVFETGCESKFEKLREVLRDARFKDEKLIVFTEHRDTLQFLVRRLEALGFTGRIASIHGGMSWQEREAQVEHFRRPASEGGATYLVATDAAGEGINLQFCWLMVNFDIPWNPARLEQRMGRIHRYKQQHDPVVIINLVAGKTREGRVLKTVLDKLEKIRAELGSDKVFDVIGRVLEGKSIRDYIEQALTDDGAEAARRSIERTLTPRQVTTLQGRERAVYGSGGDVAAELPRLRGELDREVYRRLLPGYVRRFVERAAPLLDLGVAGDLDGAFELEATRPGAMDSVWRALERYPETQRGRLAVVKPAADAGAVFLHPGEPVLDTLSNLVVKRYALAARRGAIFVDPTASEAYLVHVGLVGPSTCAEQNQSEPASQHGPAPSLVALRQTLSSDIQEVPVESVLMLRAGSRPPVSALPLVALGRDLAEAARVRAGREILEPAAQERRQTLLDALPDREGFLRRGFDYQDADLAVRRARLAEKARAGNAGAQAELARIRDQQRELAVRRERTLAELRGELERTEPGELRFIAHALVVPSVEPEDRQRYDADVEAIAVRVAWAYEEARGATVLDVSRPALARAAGLQDWPGFDLLARGPDGEERAIEVKGRAGVGEIEMKENEWARACNLRERYWLCVVYDCGTPEPRLLRVQDPFGKLIVKDRGGVLIGMAAISAAAQG